MGRSRTGDGGGSGGEFSLFSGVFTFEGAGRRGREGEREKKKEKEEEEETDASRFRFASSAVHSKIPPPE